MAGAFPGRLSGLTETAAIPPGGWDADLHRQAAWHSQRHGHVGMPGAEAPAA